MFRFHNRAVLWALIIGLVGAVLAGLVIWFVFALSEGRITNLTGWVFVLFPLCSVAIASKWPVVGGVLLIIEILALISQFSLSLIILASIQSGSSFWWLLLIPLVTGFILLTPGLLFLISRRQRQPR